MVKVSSQDKILNFNLLLISSISLSILTRSSKQLYRLLMFWDMWLGVMPSRLHCSRKILLFLRDASLMLLFAQVFNMLQVSCPYCLVMFW